MHNANQGVIDTNKIFFPNLNGVRFIAALMVIIQHTEEAKSKIGFSTFINKDGELGELGVTLFFVLSGFLITYLLLHEKFGSGTISFKNFYTRRVLRVWPLYYLVLLVGFWIIPDLMPGLRDNASVINMSKNFSTQLLLDLFFLPNVSIVLFPPIMYVSQNWSIGVEEQFYLIWPFLIKFFNSALKPLIAIIIIFICARAAALFAFTTLLHRADVSRSLIENILHLRWILGLTRIDCMAVGGVGAWILYNQKEWLLKFLYSKLAQITTCLLVIVLMINRLNFRYERHLFYSVLFVIIILNLSSNKDSIFTINNRVFNYLGKISYGLYMFHGIAITLSVKLLLKYYTPDPMVFSYSWMLVFANLFLYFFVICIVSLIATISYNYFEKFFLNKKIKYSTIISGDSVDEESMKKISQLKS